MKVASNFTLGDKNVDWCTHITVKKKKKYVYEKQQSLFKIHCFCISGSPSRKQALIQFSSRQGANIDYFDVSNVVYHKFSHGAAFYRLNGVTLDCILAIHVSNLLTHVIIFKLVFISSLRYYMQMTPWAQLFKASLA